jgi:hypothetical protein
VSKLTQRLLLPALLCAASCGSEESDILSPAAGKPPARPADAPAAQASLVPSLPREARSAEAPRTAPEAVMAIDSLVPDGSFAWMRVSSFDQLSDLADEFMTATAGSEGAMDFESALGFLPFSGVLAHIDRGTSLGLALGFADESDEVRATVMLPVVDRGAAIQALRSLPQAPQCFGIDNYVVATNVDEYRPGLGSVMLTNDLPEGQIAGRVDARLLVERFGPMLEAGLGGMALALPAPADAQQALQAALSKAARSAESVEFAINLENGEVDFSVAYVAAPDSELDKLWPAGSGKLGDLAHCLEDGDTLSMLVAVDGETLEKQWIPFYAKLLDAGVADGELLQAQQSALLEWGAFWPMFGDSVAASLRAAESGFTATYYFRPSDAAGFRERFGHLLASLPKHVPSLRVDGPEQGSLETVYRLDFGALAGADAREALMGLFPSGSATVRIAERRGISVIAVESTGGDEGAMAVALERIAQVEGKVPEGLRYVLERIDDSNPAFVARIDMGGALRNLAPLLPRGPAEQGADGAATGEPLHFTYYGGVDGRTWRFGLRTDVAQMGALVK